MTDRTDVAATSRRIYEAFNDATADRVMQHFADEATYEDPMGGVHVGKSAVRDALAPGMTGHQVYTVDQLMVSENAATITWTLDIGRGVDKISLFGLDVLHFEDGLVTSKQCFMKASELLIRKPAA